MPHPAQSVFLSLVSLDTVQKEYDFPRQPGTPTNIDSTASFSSFHSLFIFLFLFTMEDIVNDGAYANHRN